jgi:hypothetical protein
MSGTQLNFGTGCTHKTASKNAFPLNLQCPQTSEEEEILFQFRKLSSLLTSNFIEENSANFPITIT